MPADDKKKDAKGGKPGAAAPALGPDGKPLPPVELTETQQVQLQIENQASEVRFHSLPSLDLTSPRFLANVPRFLVVVRST